MKFNKNTLISWGIKSTLFLIIFLGIFLFFNQNKISGKLLNGYPKRIVYNVINTLSEKGPLNIIRSWFNTDTDSIPETAKEKLTAYQLNMVAKSLNNYFTDLLKKADALMSEPVFYRHLRMLSFKIEKYKIRQMLKQYLSENMDIAGVTLYSEQGEKLSGVKYKTVPEYQIHSKVFEYLKSRDNVMIKSPKTDFLVLISSIKQDGQIIGYLSQALSPTFFTKILDFLEIKKNIFYLKNNSHEIVLDNYNSYKFLNQKPQDNGYSFYKSLTKHKEASMAITIDKVDYSLGCIIEENNIAGNVFALSFLTVLVLLTIFLVNVIYNHLAVLAGSFPSNRFFSGGGQSNKNQEDRLFDKEKEFKPDPSKKEKTKDPNSDLLNFKNDYEPPGRTGNLTLEIDEEIRKLKNKRTKSFMDHATYN